MKQEAAIAALMLAMAAAPASADGNTLSGVPALSGEAPAVSGTLTVEPGTGLTREVEIVLEDKATGEMVTSYDEELTQELHVLAVDETFSTFVHEHAGEAGADGRFRLNVRFPKPGFYHVYADAVPTGLGQQVLRFDVPVDVSAATAASGQPLKPDPEAAGAVLEGSDGPYSVRLDASGLRGGIEGEVSLTILKDGEPATDLSPYLGVPAHAVFIAADDLSYVHAHASAAGNGQAGDHHGSHGDHGHAAEQPNTAVPAELKLHATPPQPGSYGLWVQFMGGGEVRTVPFAVTVPPSS